MRPAWVGGVQKTCFVTCLWAVSAFTIWFQVEAVYSASTTNGSFWQRYPLLTYFYLHTLTTIYHLFATQHTILDKLFILVHDHDTHITSHHIHIITVTPSNSKPHTPTCYCYFNHCPANCQVLSNHFSPLLWFDGLPQKYITHLATYCYCYINITSTSLPPCWHFTLYYTYLVAA